MRIHQIPSESIRLHQNPSESVGTHQNLPESTRTHQNPSESVTQAALSRISKRRAACKTEFMHQPGDAEPHVMADPTAGVRPHLPTPSRMQHRVHASNSRGRAASDSGSEGRSDAPTENAEPHWYPRYNIKLETPSRIGIRIAGRGPFALATHQFGH